MKILNTIALTLLIVGGLNWGLVGLFNLDLVAALFGVDTVVSNVVYTLVGVSALYCLSFFRLVSHDTTPITFNRHHPA